ncbi:arginine--tRNA ligase [Helicobacter cetorum]|uniref:Arginine--tRNA ligase n=1 Tax=Helicobacter cetorum (strain ATCC BAA-540 / CCUG 52418 / MIT 99-5656) TaxID=1163745 RepID=I0ER94_HELCM|nr:arginine--tRNA ligase [Helicobacter cetorum]AFI05463.1 arginyl-tRNA synthetase [Helicobacter cetorum MIT 99-5656]
MHTLIKSVLEEILETEVVIEYPKNREHGHYATPVAFNLAKVFKKPPLAIAEELVVKISSHSKVQGFFDSVVACKGYINFTLSLGFLERFTQSTLELKEKFGSKTPSKNSQKIFLEYVSANPTGPLHIGHARGAVFGDSLARIARFLGHEVLCEYYVNDMGAQIRLLGLSVWLAYKEHVLKESVTYPEVFYKGEYIIEIAKLASKDLEPSLFEQNEEVIIEVLSGYAKDLMLLEIKDNLDALGIHFDSYASEKETFKNKDKVFERLEAANTLYEKDSKVWLKSSLHQDESDRVLIKEDKSYTYLAGDIVYHNEKFKQDYTKFINIWGADHHGYIARVKASLNFLGYDSNKLEVLLAQMVRLLKNGEPYKMSKRAGNFILVKDVVEDIGKDALRFIFLSKRLDTHLEFDVNSLNKQDSSNPVYYIYYAHSRIHTMLDKSAFSQEEILKTPLNHLNAEEKYLLFSALSLPKVIESSFEEYGLQKMCEYLKTLASEFHSFYNACKILDTPKEKELLKVCLVVSLSLRNALSLLGIEIKKKPLSQN